MIMTKNENIDLICRKNDNKGENEEIKKNSCEFFFQVTLNHELTISI